MADIKIYVCAHRPYPVPEHPLLHPVHVGAALAGQSIPGFARDDGGENISSLNRRYCELTALYWAWKNEEADYYGLFHYRRYLYPDAAARRPYILRGAASEQLLQSLHFDRLSTLIESADLVMPRAEEMFVSVREHYARAEAHRGKDLALTEQILRELYPEYTAAAERYLSGTAHYFGNITVMKKEVFFDYCAWLFSILEEFDRRADLSGYTAQELRVDGYLAERLLGIYYTHNAAKLRTLELPRVHIEDNRKKYVIKRAELMLLPPGTRHRAQIKKLIRGSAG